MNRRAPRIKGFIKTSEHYNITQEERDELEPIIENEISLGVYNVQSVISEYRKIIKYSDNSVLIREYKLRLTLLHEIMKEQLNERASLARLDDFLIRARSTHVNDQDD